MQGFRYVPCQSPPRRRRESGAKAAIILERRAIKIQPHGAGAAIAKMIAATAMRLIRLKLSSVIIRKYMLKKWLPWKKPKILYFRFAKCAGTFLTRYFDQQYPDLVATILHVTPQRKEWSRKDFEGSFDKYYKFSLVRNPWAWQLSFYFHYRQSWQNPNRELFCEEFPTFEAWLRNNERHTLEKYASRFWWENQLFDNINYYNGLFLPDYVGKVETLSEDISEILRANNIEITCSLDQFMQQNQKKNFVSEHGKIQDNVINATKHDHYSLYYTDELVDMVAQQNRDIISSYKYEFDDRRPGR